MDRQAETDRYQNQKQEKMRDNEKDLAKGKKLEKEEKLQLSQELNVFEEKANRLKDGKKNIPTQTYCLHQ